jgi:DNA-binding Xre family transcriptional regulator
VGRRTKTMVDTQLLEETIKESGKKKTYLADKLGMSIQNLRLKINGDSDFRTNEVSILCQELGITRLTDKEKIFFKM